MVIAISVKIMPGTHGDPGRLNRKRPGLMRDADPPVEVSSVAFLIGTLAQGHEQSGMPAEAQFRAERQATAQFTVERAML